MLTFVPYQFNRDFPDESTQAPESVPQLGIDRKARDAIWVGDLEWAARRAIANLNTPEYQGAHAALEAAEQRIEARRQSRPRF